MGKAHKEAVLRKECNCPINIPEDAQLHINQVNTNLSSKITFFILIRLAKFDIKVS